MRLACDAVQLWAVSKRAPVTAPNRPARISADTVLPWSHHPHTESCMALQASLRNDMVEIGPVAAQLPLKTSRSFGRGVTP